MTILQVLKAMIVIDEKIYLPGSNKKNDGRDRYIPERIFDGVREVLKAENIQYKISGSPRHFVNTGLSIDSTLQTARDWLNYVIRNVEAGKYSDWMKIMENREPTLADQTSEKLGPNNFDPKLFLQATPEEQAIYIENGIPLGYAKKVEPGDIATKQKELTAENAQPKRGRKGALGKEISTILAEHGGEPTTDLGKGTRALLDLEKKQTPPESWAAPGLTVVDDPLQGKEQPTPEETGAFIGEVLSGRPEVLTVEEADNWRDSDDLKEQIEGRVNRNGQTPIEVITLSAVPAMGTPMLIYIADVVVTTNTRTFFNEHDLDELTENVRLKGIISPILVRPMPGQPGKYELGGGERRLRSARRVMESDPHRDMIPAYVRELSDDDLLDLRLAENLHRANLHPMEEAAAYADMVKAHPADEIAARVNKPIAFVLGRLALNDLSPLWQRAFYRDLIQTKIAIRLAALPVARQDKIARSKNLYDNNVEGMNMPISISNHDFQGDRDLTAAPFALDDATLSKKMGSCIGCKYNTATAALFPEDAQKPRCLFADDYDIKLENHTQRLVKDFKIRIDQGDKLSFVTNNYGSGDKLVDELKKAGYVVNNNYYNNDGKFKVYDIPDPMNTLEEYLADAMTEADYSRDLKAHTQQTADYHKKQQAGILETALVISGKNQGRLVYVEYTAKPSEKKIKDAIKAGTVTVKELQEQKQGVIDREKRAKELDAQKIHARVMPEMTGDCAFLRSDTHLLPVEMIALMMELWWNIGDNAQKRIIKAMGLKLDSGRSTTSHPLYEALNALTNEQLYPLYHIAIRGYLDHKLPAKDSIPGVNMNATALFGIAKQYIKGKVELFEQEQAEAAAKRGVGVAKRIADLDTEITKLQEKKSSKKK